MATAGFELPTSWTRSWSEWQLRPLAYLAPPWKKRYNKNVGPLTNFSGPGTGTGPGGWETLLYRIGPSYFRESNEKKSKPLSHFKCHTHFNFYPEHQLLLSIRMFGSTKKLGCLHNNKTFPLVKQCLQLDVIYKKHTKKFIKIGCPFLILFCSQWCVKWFAQFRCLFLTLAANL